VIIKLTDSWNAISYDLHYECPNLHRVCLPQHRLS